MRDAAGEIEPGHGGNGAGFFDQLCGVFFDGGEHAAHHAAAAQMADERAGIEIGDDGNAGLRKKCARFFVRAPVAGDAGELADDQAFDIRLRRFVIGGAGSVVADLRVGENDDLAGIGRIGEDFLIAGDGGIEDDFAGAFGGRTKTPALEDGSVFQGEDCRIQQQFLLGVG